MTQEGKTQGPRRLRTPLFPQMEAAECGAACLGSVLAYFGRWESMETLRDACHVGRDGASAADLAQAARHYGLEMVGWSKELDELRAMKLPLILFWEFRHFVVLEGIGRSRWYINDPAAGRRTVSDAEFDESFTGIALEATAGPDFRSGGAPRGIVSKLWPWLRNAKRALATALLLGFLLSILGLVAPLLLKVFVDDVLGGDTRGEPVLTVALLAGAATFVLVWLQQRILRQLSVRIAVVEGERLLLRLFRLPSRYFAHRFAGDLVSRTTLVDTVATVASHQLVSIVIEITTGILFLAVMAILDPLLAAVVVAFSAANVGLMQYFSRRRADENRQLRREQALLFGLSAAALRDIDALRATASEDGFFSRWMSYQARELASRQRFAEFGHFIAALPRLFGLLSGMAVLTIGAARVIDGEMTLGTLMGFYVLSASFVAPVSRFVAFADSLQILDADLQRIDDVRRAQPDPSVPELASAAVAGATGGSTSAVSMPTRRVLTLDGRLRLTGRIELRDVTFGYRLNRSPLLDRLSLQIEPGQRIAIIGPTGSGKSTLLRLLSGEYAPWSGQILFDGVPAGEIPREILTSSVAMVDQRIFLFAGTIHDNLTLWNPTTGDRQCVTAATDALIHDEIMSRPGGYEATVDEAGRNFSGGQQQRLEIARALAGDPAVLLLDEATSALDGRGEAFIDDALRRRGCTCVQVAHRLSTIRDSDTILVLDKGREVQRGAHDELVNDRGGLYWRLLAAQ